MKIKIITDSSSDISKEVAKELDIEIMPLTVIFGEEQYLDGIDITHEEFFDKIENGSVHPKTSQVNQFAFEEAFKNFADYDHIVCVTISSVMSGTYQSAMNAKNALKMKNVHVVDSKTTSVSEALIVLEIAKLAKDATTIEEVLEKSEEIVKNTKLLATFDTLKHLKAGGRMSGLQATIGAVLKIKLLITTDENGEVKSPEKVMSFKKAISRVRDLFAEKVDTSRPVVFGHSCTEEKMKEYVEMFKSCVSLAEYHVFKIGSTIGTHVGKGAFGVGFYLK